MSNLLRKTPDSFRKVDIYGPAQLTLSWQSCTREVGLRIDSTNHIENSLKTVQALGLSCYCVPNSNEIVISI